MSRPNCLIKLMCAILPLLVTIVAQAQPAVQWAKCFGGSGVDGAVAVENAWGGGFVIGGTTASADGDVTGNHSDGDGFVVKTDNSGNLVWAKCYGGSAPDRILSISKTRSETDSGYIITGATLSDLGPGTTYHGMDDVWVIMIDVSGNVKWQKTFGGSLNDLGCTVRQTPDGGYIVAGQVGSVDGDVTGNHGMNDYWLLKLDGQGNLVWQKAIGGSLDEYWLTLDLTYDRGFIMAGYGTSSDGDASNIIGMSDYWVVKLDSTGTIQWEKNYGGWNIDHATSVHQTRDSGYILSGKSSFNPENNGNYHSVLKIDKNGALQWSSGPWITWDLVPAKAGGYLAVYLDTTGFVLNKIDDSGSLAWTKTLAGGVGGGIGEGIVQADDGGYVVVGSTYANGGLVTGHHGLSDMWVVKLAPDPAGFADPAITRSGIRFYPNPVSEEIIFSERVNVKLLSYTGQLLADEHAVRTLDVNAYPSGLYFLMFFDDKGQLVQQEKMIRQ